MSAVNLHQRSLDSLKLLVHCRDSMTAADHARARLTIEALQQALFSASTTREKEAPAAWMWEYHDPHTGKCVRDVRKFKPQANEVMPGELVYPLYATPPDLLQMLHECAEYIAALNGEQDDYCQRARALIARATGEVK